MNDNNQPQPNNNQSQPVAIVPYRPIDVAVLASLCNPRAVELLQQLRPIAEAYNRNEAAADRYHSELLRLAGLAEKAKYANDWHRKKGA